MILNQQQLNYIYDALCGSESTLEEVLEYTDIDILELHKDDFEAIDNLTQRCDTCSWWVEPHEMENENECVDCFQHS